MKLLFISLCVLFALPLPSATWSASYPMDTSLNTQVGGLDIDSAQNVTSVQYLSGKSVPADSGLSNAQFNPDFSFARKARLDQREGVSPGTLFSLGDGKHLISISQMVRNKAGWDACIYGYLSGCIELAIYESANGGKIWLGPQLVSRTKATDAVRRVTPTVVFVKETSRIFIFYSNINYEIGKSSVGFVSKALDSAVFSAERTIFPTHEGVGGFSACYSLDAARRRPILHVVWMINVNMIMYSSSRDNGISWQDPRQIATGVDNGLLYHSTRIMSDPAEEPRTVYLYYLGKEQRYSFVKWSGDNGDSWTDGTRMSKTSSVSTGAAAACGIVVTLNTESGGGLGFSYFSTKTRKVSFGPSAFSDVSAVYMPWVTCVHDPRNSKHFTIAATANSVDKKRGYFAGHELWLEDEQQFRLTE